MSDADRFHVAYYDSMVWTRSFWRGHQCQKFPQDLFIYQEILVEKRPGLIVECGTHRGGSGLFLADICEMLGCGRVATIDKVVYPDRPNHGRLDFYESSSTESSLPCRFCSVYSERPWMVILDSDHSESHVYNELKLWSDFVDVGQYLIVEDTNINGHPVLPGWGAGPMEAVQRFLAEDQRFRVDYSREKFMVTANPGGFLLKERA